MTIRKIGGHSTPTDASVMLRDDSGHCVEVAARIHPGWSVGDKPLLDFVLRDLGQAAPEPDAEFWTQRDYEAVDLGRPEPPPEARSLAPSSWGVSCPHCGSRNVVLVNVVIESHRDTVPCSFCGHLYRIPADALTAAEARSRPTEAKP